MHCVNADHSGYSVLEYVRTFAVFAKLWREIVRSQRPWKARGQSLQTNVSILLVHSFFCHLCQFLENNNNTVERDARGYNADIGAKRCRWRGWRLVVETCSATVQCARLLVYERLLASVRNQKVALPGLEFAKPDVPSAGLISNYCCSLVDTNRT